jgi:hypothetical protein
VCGRDAPEANFRLKRECDACVHDMAQYKEMCTGGERKDAETWTARMKRMVGLTVKMQALKDLAEDATCARKPDCDRP